MNKGSFYNIKKSYIFCLFFGFFALGIFNLSAKELTNADIAGEIEKTMLFDEEARSQINFYANDVSKKKSKIATKRSNQDDKKNEYLDIVVTNSKVDNLSIREKEKLAYNASLIDQNEAAIELYKQVIALEPKNSYAKLAIAISYQKLGQTAQAKKYYYELLKSDYQDKEIVIGNLLDIMSNESPQESIYLIAKLVRQNPQSSFILASAAMAYEKINKHDEAIEMFQRAILLEPQRVDYQYNLAVIYDKLAQYDNALAFYSKVIRLDDGEDSQIPMSEVKDRIEYIRSL